MLFRFSPALLARSHHPGHGLRDCSVTGSQGEHSEGAVEGGTPMGPGEDGGCPCGQAHL